MIDEKRIEPKNSQAIEETKNLEEEEIKSDASGEEYDFINEFVNNIYEIMIISKAIKQFSNNR